MGAEAYCQDLLDTMDITKTWAALSPEIRGALKAIIMPYKQA